MNRKGLNSVVKAINKIDRDRDKIRRLRRMGFMDGSVEPRRGGEGTREIL